MANEIRVRTLSLGGFVEDDPLTDSATTLTSAALAACPVIDSTNHLAIILEPDGEDAAPEIAYITAHTAAATTATIARGQEGTTARAVSKSRAWRHTPTLRDFPRAPIGLLSTAGDTTLTTPTANAWTDINAAFDIEVPHCYAGDYVAVGLSALVAAGSPSMGFDAHSIVSSAAVNSWSYNAAVVEGADATRFGTNGWFATTAEHNLGATIQKMLVSGDLSSSTLTLRLRYKPSASSPDRVFYSSLADPFQWWAHNKGPKVIWL